MNIVELLQKLGWPKNDADKKGTMNWQGPIVDGQLPTTASLVVTPKSIRATVLNIDGQEALQPHFQAQWDITGATPQLKTYILAGQDIADKGIPDPATQFQSLVVLLNQKPPKVDIMGFRQKNILSVDNGSSLKQ